MLRHAMGQLCSCLQPRPQLGKARHRRNSDADTEGYDEYDAGVSLTRVGDGSEYEDDDSGDEIRILIDGERDTLLPSQAVGMTKRTSKSALLRADDDSSTGGYSSGGNGTRLMGEQQADPMSEMEQRRNMEVLRSYQQVTGVVDSGQLDLECVMCLDTFSDDNPKVRTLCNCGMNRTNFHLSCLLEWLNRDANCPVCRQYLFYEDA